jgi:hypothetical protein
MAEPTQLSTDVSSRPASTSAEAYERVSAPEQPPCASSEQANEDQSGELPG